METGGRGRIFRGMLPLLGLHVANEYYRLERKPPVTAGLLVANTLVYLRPGFLQELLPSIEEVWFNPHLIIKYGDLRRFFLSAFYHMGEHHLFYNMTSLLWKGIQLETSMGSFEFAAMVAELLAMSQGITLLLARCLYLFFDYQRAYYDEYSVGFSGVLFAMKVVLNSRSSGEYTNVHGLIVPVRHAAWAELILIQLFVPGVSFLGHLGGILAGLLYLQLKRSYSGRDPLTALLRSCAEIIKWPFRLLGNLLQNRQRRIFGRGTVGGNYARTETRRDMSATWRCTACTYDNSLWLNTCEMCGTGRERESFRNNRRSSWQALSIEEMRRRRIERFG